jgi:hypothetical protein
MTMPNQGMKYTSGEGLITHMKQVFFSRALLWLVFAASVASVLVGCGGSSGSGTSSSWLGLSSTLAGTGSTTVRLMVINPKLAPTEICPVAVQVLDQYGQPADDVTVQVSSLVGGTYDNPSGETRKGWFYARFTAGDIPGTETLAAIANGTVATQAILISPRAFATPTVTIFMSNPKVAPKGSMAIAVYVSQYGMPLKNENAQVTMATNKTGVFSPEIGNLNSNGWFTTSFNAGDELETLTISATCLGVVATASLEVVTAPPAKRLMKITASPNAIYLKQETTIVVQMTDDKGNPANGNVVFATSLDGKFSPSEGEIKDGILYSTFTAGTEPGSATLSVFFFGTEATTTLNIYRPKTIIQVQPAEKSVKKGGAKNPITIYVANEINSPIPNSDVLLSGTSGITFDDDKGKTNDNGFFSTFYTAGPASGSSLITAMAEESIGTATVTFW